MINPMGHDPETVWSGLKEGKSGVARTTLFDASGFPTQISAEVKNWDITDTGEPPELWKNRGRHTKFAAGAAKQAIDTGLSTDLASGLEVERQQFAALFATGDQSTGMRSFIENGPGKAVFEGR